MPRTMPQTNNTTFHLRNIATRHAIVNFLRYESFPNLCSGWQMQITPGNKVLRRHGRHGQGYWHGSYCYRHGSEAMPWTTEVAGKSTGVTRTAAGSRKGTVCDVQM